MPDVNPLHEGDIKNLRLKLLYELFGSGTTELFSKLFLLLTHENPDTDAILSLWAVREHVLKPLVPDMTCSVDFVPAGPLVESKTKEYVDKNYNVIPMDVGRGIFDQHTKDMTRGSSFELVVDYFQLGDEPGIQHLVELARATDNVERVSKTSIHYAFKSLPYQCRGEDGEVDWHTFLDKAFEILDAYQGAWKYEAESEEMWKALGGNMLKKLENGFTIAQLGKHARLRDVAYNAGADCVVFFDKKNVKVEVDDGRAHCVCVQLNLKHRDNPNVSLHTVAAALRATEAAKRGVNVDGIDLTQMDSIPEIGAAWFRHGSTSENGAINCNIVLCGSRSKPIRNYDELTQLTWHEIYKTVRQEMKKVVLEIPKATPAPKPASTPAKTDPVKKPAKVKTVVKKVAAKKKSAKKKRS